MIAALAALIPVFVCIVLGLAFRRSGFLADGFWAPAEKLNYYVMLPALLVSNLVEARFAGLPVAALAGLLIGTTLAAAGGMVLLRRRLPGMSGAAFSSMLQGTVRPNTFIGLAAAAALWGSQGLALLAIAIAAVVPLVNLISVAGLLAYATPGRPGWRRLAMPIITNPLILACLAGIALNAAEIPLPLGVGPSFKILGSAALPIGLLVVGAGLNLKALSGTGLAVLLTSLFKLILLPALTAGLALLVGLPPMVVGVATLYAALPCAPSAYVLARQMNGDAALAASIITVQTLLAGITIPMILLTLG